MEEYVPFCSICFENICNPTSGALQRIKVVSALECGHVFHRHCILTWFTTTGVANAGRCPICQQRAGPGGMHFPNLTKLFLSANPSTTVQELKESVTSLKNDKIVLQTKIESNDRELARKDAELEYKGKQLEEKTRQLVIQESICRGHIKEISDLKRDLAWNSLRYPNQNQQPPPNAHTAQIQRSPMNLSKRVDGPTKVVRNPLVSSNRVPLQRSATCVIRDPARPRPIRVPMSSIQSGNPVDSD